MDWLKRKYYIKLLSVQAGIRKFEASYENCDCTHGDIPATSGMENNEAHDATENDADEGKIDNDVAADIPNQRTSTNDRNDNESYYTNPTKFVWATGGHSTAAGHGNLYNETYTAYLVRAAKPVFQSIGIDFVGRNCGMGDVR